MTVKGKEIHFRIGLSLENLVALVVESNGNDDRLGAGVPSGVNRRGAETAIRVLPCSEALGLAHGEFAGGRGRGFGPLRARKRGVGNLTRSLEGGDAMGRSKRCLRWYTNLSLRSIPLI